MAAPAPKKLTIKLRPVGSKPAAPAAPAAAPAPEPVAAPEAPIAEMPPVADAPAAPAAAPAPEPTPAPEAPAAAPIGIKLRPVGAPTPAPETDLTSEAAQQAKRQTSRIELPPEIASTPMNAQEASTIRLKPISQAAEPAKDDPQASKSKTARIALDSVLGGIQANTPLANTTQKTIKLKRAATPATPAAATPSTPMAPVGAEDKTIKLAKPAGISIKKPAGLSLKKPAAEAAPAADNDLESLDSLESLDDLPPIADVPVATESGVSKAFTIIGTIAAVAVIVIGIMTWMVFQKQANSPDGSQPTGNTLHSFAMKRF